MYDATAEVGVQYFLSDAAKDLNLAPGPEWEPSAWRGTMTGQTLFRRKLVTAALAVRVFDREERGEGSC